MNLKNKQQSEKKTLSLRLFYSEMIKLGGGIGLYLYFRPKVYRISDKVPKLIKGRYLIAANHRSMKDPIILFLTFWNRRLYFPAAKELFEKPINRFFFHNMNCIPIDRSTHNMGAIRRMCGLLEKNRAVVIFPEGAINTTEEELLGFKKGTAFMANKSRSPVLPVYIGERERWWQCIPVVIGEPVDVSEICKKYPRTEAVDRASEYLRDEEARLAEFYQTLRSNKAKRCI